MLFFSDFMVQFLYWRCSRSRVHEAFLLRVRVHRARERVLAKFLCKFIVNCRN